MHQFSGPEREPGFGMAGGEMVAHPVEAARIGPLEGIDRLLLVAHDKDRALHLGPRALPAGEFLG